MKLLFVIRDVHGWAGTERVLNLIANALADRFEIEILSLSHPSADEAGYPYRPEVKCSYLPVFLDNIGSIFSNFRIAAYIEHGNYDVVILAGVGEIKYFLITALKHQAKLIAWEHFNIAISSRKFNRRFAARFCDAIVTLTKQDAADWKRMLRPRARILQIPNPVPYFPEHSAVLEAKRILALGRLEEQKRFDLLLEAFAEFHKTHQDWMLRIRGSGSKEDELRAKIASLGLSNSAELLSPTIDVQSEYRGASIYAMSSKFEGFPMTLIEAMAFGVPCASFNCPNGPAEIIKNGEDGFIVPNGDVSALTERLAMLADNEALRRRMGSRAKENIRRYEVGQIAKSWTDFLEGLCAR